MRIERVDDKTVKCFLSNEELQEYQIDYKDFITRSDKAREIVHEIMEQAKEEVGYTPPKFAFDLQIMMVPDQGMLLTFSEKDPFEGKDAGPLLDCLKEMQQALTPIQQKISKARRAAVVEMKQLEVSQLEEQIYRDIAGRAAKLAIIHHLTLILAQPAPGTSGNGLMSLPETMWQKQGIEIPVVGVKTIDLTDEMLQEMNTL